MPTYASRHTYACPACGATYRVSFRNVVQAALGAAIGAVAGLPLWFVAVAQSQPRHFALGFLLGLIAVSLVALVSGVLAGRIAFRLVPVSEATARGAESEGKGPVA